MLLHNFVNVYMTCHCVYTSLVIISEQQRSRLMIMTHTCSSMRSDLAGGGSTMARCSKCLCSSLRTGSWSSNSDVSCALSCTHTHTRRGIVVSGVLQWTKLTHVGPGYNWDWWPSSSGYTISGCNQPTRSTQPCIPPGSINRVPASAGVTAGMSPLPGGR